jgi:TolA-binding protein
MASPEGLTKALEKDKEILPMKNSDVPQSPEPLFYYHQPQQWVAQQAQPSGYRERRSSQQLEGLEDRVSELERHVELLKRQNDLSTRQLQTLLDMFADRLLPKKKR